MPVVSFVDADGVALARVDAMPGDTLIDVARFHGVDLHWRCGQGTCGTCAVHLVHAGQPAEIAPRGMERNALARAGRVSAAQAAQPRWADTADTWRLACHVVVGERELEVRL